MQELFDGVDGTIYIVEKVPGDPQGITFSTKPIGKGFGQPQDAASSVKQERAAREAVSAGKMSVLDGYIAVPVKVVIYLELFRLQVSSIALSQLRSKNAEVSNSLCKYQSNLMEVSVKL